MNMRRRNDLQGPFSTRQPETSAVIQYSGSPTLLSVFEQSHRLMSKSCITIEILMRFSVAVLALCLALAWSARTPTQGRPAGVQTPQGASILILGTGEFQYLPYLLALRLERARPDLRVLNSATTRSPVAVWGQIAYALEFTDNYGDTIPNFLYNVRPGQYDQVWVGYEGLARPDPVLLDLLNASAVRLA